MADDIEHAYGWVSQQEDDSNRLKWIQHYKVAVSPAEANISFKVAAERVTLGTDVRGRIVGPRCLFSETPGMVAPLRTVKYREGEELILIARTAFPNPGFWTSDNPWLYRVVLELWQDERCCAVSGFDMGFPLRIDMGRSGVLVYGEPLLVRGMAHLPQSTEEADHERQKGYNLVLAGKGQWHWWVRANPMGFLLLERVALSTLTPAYIGLVSQQPCFLGFVVGKEVLDRSPAENESFFRQEPRVLIGLELDGPPPRPLPSGLSFLVCPESALAAFSTLPLPSFVLRESNDVAELPAREGIVGWIDQ